MTGVEVPDLEIYGELGRLVVNGVDVVPLVEAELNRRMPERALMSPGDVAGFREAFAVLDRLWAEKGRAAGTADEFLSIVADTIARAQHRSAGLVLAVLEGALTDPSLAELSAAMISQRAVTAAWVIDQLAAKAALHGDLDRDDAVDTLWILMDPAVFDRLVRQRDWSIERYQRWFARSAQRLLIADEPTTKTVSTTRRQR
jgi:hypothetical protein